MNSLRPLVLALLTISLFVYPAHAVTWQTIDIPGSLSTALTGINLAGDMIGVYQDNTGAYSFLLSGGTVTNIQFPGALATSVHTINDSGDTAGSYTGTDRVEHGFLLHAGTYTTIDFPGAAFTAVYGMNNLGDMVGYYLDFSNQSHAFERIAGTFTTIDTPHAKSTTVNDIDDADNATGTATFGILNKSVGFVLTHGHYSHIRVPGSAQTNSNGINNRKQVVGYAIQPDGSVVGFTFFNGQYTTLAGPVGTKSLVADDVNDNGDVVGTYTDGSNVEHGFLRTP